MVVSSGFVKVQPQYSEVTSGHGDGTIIRLGTLRQLVRCTNCCDMNQYLHPSSTSSLSVQQHRGNIIIVIIHPRAS